MQYCILHFNSTWLLTAYWLPFICCVFLCVLPHVSSDESQVLSWHTCGEIMLLWWCIDYRPHTRWPRLRSSDCRLWSECDSFSQQVRQRMSTTVLWRRHQLLHHCSRRPVRIHCLYVYNNNNSNNIYSSSSLSSLVMSNLPTDTFSQNRGKTQTIIIVIIIIIFNTYYYYYYHYYYYMYYSLGVYGIVVLDYSAEYE